MAVKPASLRVMLRLQCNWPVNFSLPVKYDSEKLDLIGHQRITLLSCLALASIYPDKRRRQFRAIWRAAGAVRFPNVLAF
jgi:hypothetical protein